MSETASVILTGEIMPGYSPSDVIAALAKVLKTTEEKAAKLIAGRETVIKREVPVDKVGRYIQALVQAGAKARVQHERAQASGFPEIVESLAVPTAMPPLPSLSALSEISAPAPVPTAAPAPVAQRRYDLAPEPEFTPAPAPAPREKASALSGLSLVDTGEQKHAPTDGVKHDATCPECGKGQPFRSMCRYCGAHMDLASERRASTADNSESSIYAAPKSRDWKESTFEETYTPPVFGMSTSGRIGRLRYLAYLWPTMGAAMVGGIVAALLVPKSPTMGVVLTIPVIVVAFWMMIRMAVMRLHDLNRSGKWIIGVIVLFGAAGASGSVGLILAASALFWIGSLAMTFWPGSGGGNDYGPPPGPNTTLVKVGAGLIIAFQVLSVIGNAKYGAYRNKVRASQSADQPDGGQQQYQAPSWAPRSPSNN